MRRADRRSWFSAALARSSYSHTAYYAPSRTQGAYKELRRNLGRSILLGLEVLIVADIVRTIIVDPTIESVAVLGVIVAIRIALSFSLEVEIDGVWPWRRWQRMQTRGADVPPESFS